MLERLRTYRRDLHRIPELDFDLPRTVAYVEGMLRPLGCEVTHPAQSAVCAFFDAGKADTVAFRADLDALPVQEATGAAYSSIHPGKMHACGHDGHTALLLALAGLAAERLASLSHNVLLIFQPGEETTGGAKDICESGILEKYNTACIFGLHLWPELPKGTLWTRPGPVMAKTGIVQVEIEGKSAHVTRAAQGADALRAGVEFLHRAYAMAETIPPLDEERLLKFGLMQSGATENALSDHTYIRGTMRAFSAELHGQMHQALCGIAAAVEGETGCRLHLSLSEGYPPVVNDAALYARLMAHLGADAPALLAAPFLTGEDFSFYQQRVAGVFFFLGTGGGEPLHGAAFDFDEAVLLAGLGLYERLLAI
ncbi:MAG: amidohydrolase [Candidatus Pelethousia sp.]|nr:amidohydrolase [Candidatus Pelethousia sp.]